MIFWYFLLGPVAALSYRLLALAAEHSQQPALAERAAQLRHAFDWLPVRLLAASFALVGNFVAVSRVMLHELLNWNISAAQLIEKPARLRAKFRPPWQAPRASTAWINCGNCCCVRPWSGTPGSPSGPSCSNSNPQAESDREASANPACGSLTLSYKNSCRFKLYRSSAP